MNVALISKTLGALFILLAFTMAFPLGTSTFYKEADTNSFLISCALTLSVGIFLYLKNKKTTGQLRSKEAILLVALTWVLITVFGAVPYYLYPQAYNSVVDAWFESVSGFTTTGATVIGDIEALPHGILLWRSLSQYIGGMGIIVLSVAILPLLGVGGMDLYRAEVPGPTNDKISSRVSQTARVLWVVYLLFAIIETAVLCGLGMGFFDAVNHSLTTMSSGGFSTKNASVAGFDSAAIEMVITFFMFCAGVSFLAHYRFFFRGDFKVLRDSEFRFYFMITVTAILVLAAGTFGTQYATVSETLRYVSFQVVSIVTTTGFGTSDYILWGPLAHALLLVLMVVGGSSGSTSGGIKCVRAILLVKQAYRELYLTIHRKAVFPIKLGGKTVANNVTNAIFGFFFLYIFLLVLTSLLICACGVDLTTAVSGTISALSNIGPGLGEVGPMFNYGGLPEAAKFLLSLCMIIGRLEFFTILVLFTSEYWSS